MASYFILFYVDRLLVYAYKSRVMKNKGSLWHDICSLSLSLSLFILAHSTAAQTAVPLATTTAPVHREVSGRVAFSPGGGGIPLILAELEQARSRVDVAMLGPKK